MSGEYTRNLQYPKAQLKAAAEKLAAQLGITLKARTKKELSSFLVYHEGRKPDAPQVGSGVR